MRKTYKIILIITGIITFLVILFLTILVIVSAKLQNDVNKEQSIEKTALSSQLTKFTVPTGCTEKSKNFTGFNGYEGDIVPTWSVNYNCNIAAGVAYDSIVTNLHSIGFNPIPGEDFDPPGSEAASYSFSYDGNGFEADYIFEPETYVPVSRISVLQKSRVTFITLNLVEQ